MQRTTLAITISAVLITLCSAVFAQGPAGPNYATATVKASPTSVKPGAATIITVSLNVATGFHVNSVKPNDPDLIATTVSVGPLKGIKPGAPVYPVAKVITAPSLSPKPLSVYVGNNKITIPVTVTTSAKPGKYAVPITVNFQGCNAVSCYPPKSETLTASIVVL